jgi:hypothetical protein
MRLPAVFFCILIFQWAFPQDSANRDLSFLLGKIRTTYAGYRDKVKEPEFDALVRRAAQDRSPDSFRTLSQVTGYFKDDHLSLFQVVAFDKIDSGTCRNNRAMIAHDMAQIARDMAHPAHPSPHNQRLDGYYINDLGDCVIYLKETSRGEWAGFLVESRTALPAGLCILRMKSEGPGRWIADFTLPGDKFRVFTPAWLKEDRVLVGGGYFKFSPCKGYTPGMLAGKKAFSYDPALIAIDSQTVLLHMPDFGAYNKRIYDSLIRANAVLLSRARTLILDIRNNAGGSIGCFLPLLPYICTAPVQTTAAWQLCSNDLIGEAKADLKKYRDRKDTANTSIYEAYVADMEKHRDSFRLIESRQLACEARPNQLQNVAIIMDHGTRSAAELMVLYFKQSARVKLFGENTRGAVDYLDLLSYKLPVSGYQLWVGTSKRATSAAQPTYDATGIPPDVGIPDSEPDWIAFVRNYYRRLGNTRSAP